jgi:4-pyridoxolactonase
MKLWLLDTGSIVIEHTQLLWNVPGDPVRIPSYAVLVEHDDGLYLFDTGFGLEHTSRVLPFEHPEQTAEQTIPAQLRLCGFTVSDVTTLVNSHLHFDHVGGNGDFAGTGVRNVVHAREIAQARHHEPFEYFGYSDRSWDYDGVALVPVTGDLELAPGIRLYETPGHTVGHYSVLLAGGGDSSSRAMLFPFDVVYTAVGLEKGMQPGFHHDPVAGVRSIRRIKALVEEHGADVFFSHDPEAWRAYRQAPDSYEL